MGTLSIGHGGFITLSSVRLIVDPNSAPIKRILNEAKGIGKLIDSTHGRMTRSAIRLDNGDWVLSAIGSTTLKTRYEEVLEFTQGYVEVEVEDA